MWLAAAFLLTEPLKPLLTADDVPFRMLKHNVPQTVAVALTLNPDGSVLRCVVEHGSGNSELDDYTCRVLSRRAKYRPPVLIDGRGAYGVEQIPIRWWVGDGILPSLQYANVRLTVASLPKGAKPPVLVKVNLDVSETGHVSNCAAAKTNDDPALVRAACNHFMKTLRLKPALNAQGVSVPSAQVGTVSFSTEPQ